MGANNDISFGTCPVCGTTGNDYVAGDLTGADSTSSLETAGSGVVLILRNGQLMCEMCKNRLDSDEVSRMSAQKHAEAERFRRKCGFVKEVQ